MKAVRTVIDQHQCGLMQDQAFPGKQGKSCAESKYSAETKTHAYAGG